MWGAAKQMNPVKEQSGGNTGALWGDVYGEQVCCQCEECWHPGVEDKEYAGWMVDGKLKCLAPNGGDCTVCCLDWELEVDCQVVQLLDGHVHNDACGHRKVSHGDHMDYLVDGRLHHVVNEEGCCGRKCLGFVNEATIVDHGDASALRQRLRPVASEAVDRDPDEDKEIVTSIYVSSICCPSEVPIIHKILNPLPGVMKVAVAVTTKTVRVTHIPSKTSPGVMVSALNGAGLDASLGERGQGSDGAHTRPPWTVVLSGFLLLISIMSVVHEDVEEAKYVAIAAAVVGMPHICLRSIAALRRFILDINVLMMIAVGGAMALQEYHEAAAIVFLFGFAEWLEDRSMEKARIAVRMLSEMQPEKAVDANTGKSIPVEDVQVNSILLVRPGDRIPVDGIAVTGESAVDESMLTGESRAVPKYQGSEMKSGTVNSGKGSLVMRSTADFESSTIAKVAALVEEASMQKSDTEKFIEKFAKIYTPLIIISAALLIVVPISIGTNDYKKWVYLSLVLLVTACPCALVISAPVVTVCGIAKAVRQSILIKGGQYLEALASVSAVTFDKTGTLTEGRFGVTSIHCVDGVSEKELIELAASLELHSTHPLGTAIAGSAGAKGYNNWYRVTGMQVVAGQGITGIVSGQLIGCGNQTLMSSIAPGSSLPLVSLEGGESICYVARGSHVIGAISVSDVVRKEAGTTIERLADLGVESAMLTGDSSSAAHNIARYIGMTEQHVHAALLPKDKLDMVRDYKRTFGTIAHIGDGINDAPALAQADVGIAMGIGGSALAVEAADIALFTNDLRNLPKAIEISKCVRSKMIQNISFAIALKIVVIGLAIANKVGLWQAVLADVGGSLVVVLNGLTILGFSKGTSAESTGPSCYTERLEKDCEENNSGQDLSHLLTSNEQGSCCGQEKAPRQAHGEEGGIKCCGDKNSNNDSFSAKKKGSCCAQEKDFGCLNYNMIHGACNANPGNNHTQASIQMAHGTESCCSSKKKSRDQCVTAVVIDGGEIASSSNGKHDHPHPSCC